MNNDERNRRLFKLAFRILAFVTLATIVIIPRLESPSFTETQLLAKYWVAYAIGIIVLIVFWWASNTGDE